MRDHGVDLFEEPCFWQDIEATAEVNRRGGVPVAGGEQDFDAVRWEAIAASHAVSVAQPDVCYCGGLSRSMQIARIAGLAGIPVMPHCSNPSLVMLFGMTLMRVVPNPGPYVEYGIEENAWLQGAFEPALEVVAGAVAFPAGPGWGVTVNESWLRERGYRESRRV